MHNWQRLFNKHDASVYALTKLSFKRNLVMDDLCHSRSNTMLRSWQPLCYSCGIRLATTVAEAIGMV